MSTKTSTRQHQLPQSTKGLTTLRTSTHARSESGFRKNTLATCRQHVYERAVILNSTFAALALLSLGLTLWQWLAARRFPLHQRGQNAGPQPGVTLLKPLKGCDEHTESCLRSWLAQDYTGEIQVLFGVASADDPASDVVRKLLAECPHHDAQLVVCPLQLGPNAKVAKLAQLELLARNEIIVLSDADVRVPSDLMTNLVGCLNRSEGDQSCRNVRAGSRSAGVSLVSCLYRLANPSNLAMQCEAIAINADFWSQVLQAASFRKMDFALGAVLATRRKQLTEIGGFKALVDFLADDYQLGHRLAERGHRIELCPVVVDCWSPPLRWCEVWKHQLRWARTIRVCQPLPYFFSVLTNVTFWSLAWVVAGGAVPTFESHSLNSGGFVTSFAVPGTLIGATSCVLVRILAAMDLQRRLAPMGAHLNYFWLVPVKDLLQFALWAGAFLGNSIEWRGQRCRLRRDGTLVPL